MKTDASVCHAFANRKGVGRMKHLSVRYMRLQNQLDRGIYSMVKIPRSENPGDMFTHAPSAAEIQKFLEQIGTYPMVYAKDVFEVVKAALVKKPNVGPSIAGILMRKFDILMQGQVRESFAPPT